MKLPRDTSSREGDAPSRTGHRTQHSHPHKVATASLVRGQIKPEERSQVPFPVLRALYGTF